MLANWVKQAVTVGGTGNLTLGSADAGHITCNDAKGTNVFFNYTIEDGNNRESGIGYLSASTTLVRSTVLETLVSGTLDRTSPAAITVTTSAKVMITADANTLVAGHRPAAFVGAGFAGMHSEDKVDETDGSISMGSSYRFMFPFRWRSSQQISEIACTVHTAGTAAARTRLGLYEIDSDGLPGRLLIEFTATTQIDVSTTGLKSQSDTAIYLPAGDYYIGLHNNETITYKCPLYSQSGIFMGANSSGLQLDRLYRTVAYGAFGDETASSWTESIGGGPTFWIK